MAVRTRRKVASWVGWGGGGRGGGGMCVVMCVW